MLFSFLNISFLSIWNVEDSRTWFPGTGRSIGGSACPQWLVLEVAGALGRSSALLPAWPAPQAPAWLWAPSAPTPKPCSTYGRSIYYLVVRVLYIFQILIHIRYIIFKYLLPFCSLYFPFFSFFNIFIIIQFPFFDSILWSTKVFNFGKIYLVFISLLPFLVLF